MKKMNRTALAFVVSSAVAICAAGSNVLPGKLSPPHSPEDSASLVADEGKVSEPSERHSWADAQGRLAPIAESLEKLLDPKDSGFPLDPGGQSSGFNHIEIRPLDNTYSLYWKGKVPAEVLHHLESFETQGEIVDVGVSKSEITTATQLALEEVGHGSFSERHPVVSITPTDDYDGIVVALSDHDSALSQVDLAQLPSSFGAAKVTWVSSKGPGHGYEILPQASRLNDASPWWGGAGMWLNHDGYRTFCTSAVGIEIEGTGNEYLLTAKHCAEGHYAGLVEDIANDDIGVWELKANWTRPSLDAILINPNSGAVGTNVYTGSYTSATSINPLASSKASIGAIVCVEGARFGENCASGCWHGFGGWR